VAHLGYSTDISLAAKYAIISFLHYYFFAMYMYDVSGWAAVLVATST
jgi:hypothetical protein